VHFASGDDGESDSTWRHVPNHWVVENGLNEQIEQTESGAERRLKIQKGWKG